MVSGNRIEHPSSLVSITSARQSQAATDFFLQQMIASSLLMRINRLLPDSFF